jgi:hypothetical protein
MQIFSKDIMKLEDKGPVIAPPMLAGWAQKVSLEIQSWPAMISATHWQFGDPTQVDGVDFYVSEHELGHIHLDGMIHLVLSDAMKKAVMTAGFASPFRWDANFVQSPITDPPSAEHALWLFKLGYDRLSGVDEAILLQRIESAQLTVDPSLVIAA